MAKLKGPLFSLSAGGSIGPRLTYSMRKSGAQVRIQKVNTDAKSVTQLVERGFYQEALAGYATLSQSDKSQWDDFNRS